MGLGQKIAILGFLLLKCFQAPGLTQDSPPSHHVLNCGRKQSHDAKQIIRCEVGCPLSQLLSLPVI